MFSALLLSNILLLQAAISKADNATGSMRSVSWYAGWHSADFPLSQVSWSKYTQLTYAFAWVFFFLARLLCALIPHILWSAQQPQMYEHYLCKIQILSYCLNSSKQLIRMFGSWYIFVILLLIGGDPECHCVNLNWGLGWLAVFFDKRWLGCEPYRLRQNRGWVGYTIWSGWFRFRVRPLFYIRTESFFICICQLGISKPSRNWL